MSKKNIENYIPEAMKVLREKYPDGKIASAYNGYISSFGASIIQSGLKATLAVYENEKNKDKTEEDKTFLPKIIMKILDENHPDDSLLRYVLIKGGNEAILKQKILDIAVAVKLSIRTFKLVQGASHG